MFAGFLSLFLVLVVQYGGFSFLEANLPPDHLSWHGGNSTWYIAVWYVIALATLIEPAFFQRCYAAKTSKVARSGIFISIGCWAFFDFMTTTCGLYARAILPDLADPVASYPALAQLVLPAGLLGLFALALLATVMSTVDSYSFLAATTLGNDIARPILKLADRQVKRYTFYGLIISTTLAVGFALFFRSVVDIWHAFGSVGTPALLLPVVTSLVGQRRLEAGHAFISVVTCGLLSFFWYLSKYFSPTDDYWLQVEPIFPGLILSAIIYVSLGRKVR
jgi:SSS family solute:Na+ symporter